MKRTLCIDIGGSHIKAALVAPDESFLSERVEIDTPSPADPELLMQAIGDLVTPLPAFDRIAAGFPGVVRHGVLRTAANLGDEAFLGFNLEKALKKALGKPARVANDADVQGLGAITGTGMEVVITLGTGFGSAIFEDGVLGPHIELAHHPFRKKSTYEDLLGERALDEHGKKQWRKNVRRAVAQIRQLTAFDHLHIGGGNGRHLEPEDLGDDVSVVPNTEGIAGGVWLWEKRKRAGDRGRA
jgi:polyphosphate glucokinase